MTNMLKQRRNRFDALHALLTGEAFPARLRRDVGLPEDGTPPPASGFVLNIFGYRDHR